MGSRRIFAPKFKLQVLDSYRKDADCRGNQRATARKYGIHRRQIQKWLQVENSLRSSIEVVPDSVVALNLCSEAARQRDDNGGESFDKTCADKMSESPKTEVPKCGKEFNISLFPIVTIEESVKYEQMSEDEMENSSTTTTDGLESDQPLDFTLATLSKRRSFSLQFKLEVLDAFHNDRICCGNQRATARKFGINRRQVQKWLGQEPDLRGEASYRGGIYRQRLGRLIGANDSRHPYSPPFQPSNISSDVYENDSQEYCWDFSKQNCDPTPVPLEENNSRIRSYNHKFSDGIGLENRRDYAKVSEDSNLSKCDDGALCLVKNSCVIEESVSEKNLFMKSCDMIQPLSSLIEVSNVDRVTATAEASISQSSYYQLVPKVDNPYNSFHSYDRLMGNPNGYPLHLNVNTVDYCSVESDCYKPHYFIPSANNYRFHSCHSQEWLKNEIFIRNENCFAPVTVPRVLR